MWTTVKSSHSCIPGGIRYRQGFTLIEALVTVSVLAVIASLAIPSYVSFTQKKEVEDAAGVLANGFRFAASEALARGKSVILLPFTANTENALIQWSSGWKACLPDAPKTDCLEGGDLFKVESIDNVYIKLAPVNTTSNTLEATGINVFEYNGLGVAAARGDIHRAEVYASKADADAGRTPLSVVEINNMGVVRTNAGE